ncbi:MAG: hypothetical protein QOD63_1532, partial [Actinomycetota bacterium]|nr:hypothetical protein [Actinomycetota bacterium]
RVTDSAPDVPGKRLLMRGTGHSISDARPAHLADEVVRFFAAGTATQRAGSDGVVSWEPGRLDMFRTGTDGRAYHKFFAGGWGPGGITADWEPVGGPGRGVRLRDRLSVVSWEPGRLDVFGTGTDGRAYHKFFGGGWGPGGMTADWEAVGGPASGVGFVGAVTAVSWERGRLDVLGTGTDGRVHHNFFAGGWGPGGITADWEPVGGPGRGVAARDRLSVVAWEPGRLDIVGTGTDGRAYHKFFAGGWGPGGITADWEPVGGPAGGSFAGAVDVTSWGPGRLDIVGTGTDGRVYHKFFGGGWGPGGITADWEPVGGPRGVATREKLGVVAWEPGRLDIVGTGTDGRAYHKFFGGGWGPGGMTADWEPVGGSASGLR